jgi:tight adherence protein C
MSAALASLVMSRTAPAVKRLHTARPAAEAVALPSDSLLPWARARKSLRKSPRGTGSLLQRRLTAAGWEEPHAATLFTASQIGLAAILGIMPMLVLGLGSGSVVAFFTAVIGYMIPDFALSKRIARRRMAIRNGLPDALDLMVVCVEAGSSLDQAITKSSQELAIALPEMAEALASVAGEIRAGKPRLEAFHDFAQRTRLDEVRALVTMLIQTDRFGTSIAQALRTHAETLRTTRRQLAEERAGKIGVKLVFPLVLCLLPALYVVCLGPVGIRIYRALF